MKKNMLVVFGPGDPEQVAAEQIVVAASRAVWYACTTDADGRSVRVHPGNAYAATGYYPASDPLAYYHGPAWADVTHLFECAPSDTSDLASDVIRLDHHRPGDPGYGRPPAEFLPASAIGQLVSFLAAHGLWRGEPLSSSSEAPGTVNCDGSGWAVSAVGALRHPGGDPCWVARPTWASIPADIVMVAAADHCLEAAYRGRCPGVYPNALMRWRAQSRAAFQSRSVEAVLADVAAARARLLDAYGIPCRDCGGRGGAIGGGSLEAVGEPCHAAGVHAADMRGPTIPELPEAACREGIPYLATVRDRDGRAKVVLGAASAELVRRFMEGKIVPGLVDYYGVPERGYAGAYIA